MKEIKLSVREIVAAAETLYENVERLKREARADGRTAARFCYGKAQAGLSRAIHQLMKIRDFASRD